MPSVFPSGIPFWEHRITEKNFCTGRFFREALNEKAFRALRGGLAPGERPEFRPCIMAGTGVSPAHSGRGKHRAGRNAPDDFVIFRARAWENRLRGGADPSGRGKGRAWNTPGLPFFFRGRRHELAGKVPCFEGCAGKDTVAAQMLYALFLTRRVSFFLWPGCRYSVFWRA